MIQNKENDAMVMGRSSGWGQSSGGWGQSLGGWSMKEDKTSCKSSVRY